jgi:exosortase/archaeosortase family protein
MARRRHLLILLAAQAAAFWPVWRWLAARLADGGEATALAACAAALLIPPREREGAAATDGSIRLAALLTLAYAGSVLAGPPVLRAMLAGCALLATWSAWRWGARPHPAATGLMLLALPVLPTAQFVLGYPLRVAAGELAARLLSLAGLAVAREGVALRLGERLVAIDAPCSGVNMLWTALLVALALAALGRCSLGRTALLGGAATALAITGNGVRAASLFLTESGVLSRPAGLTDGAAHRVAHQGVGVVAFALALAPLLWLHRRIQPEVAPPCAPGSPS